MNPDTALLHTSSLQREADDRMKPRVLLHGDGDRVLWRGLPATVTGIGTEYGSIVYDVLLDDGEHRQRWAYEGELEAMS